MTQNKPANVADRWIYSDDVLALMGAERGNNYVPKEFKNIAPIETATEGDIVFCWSKEGISSLMHSRASLAVVSPVLINHVPKGISAMVAKYPQVAFAKLATHMYPSLQGIETWDSKDPSSLEDIRVHKTASIHPTAVIGRGTAIDAGVVIGPHVTIGTHGKIFANATISHATIGDRVTIYPGAVIGQAGFGFLPTPEGPIDLPHLGRVIIGDNVRIGANTTVDRGLIGSTVIEMGCRIDNLVQIAHNVRLGRHCVIVAQVGIAGSTSVGEGTMMGGQVGVSDHITIGRNVKIAAQSGVMRAIEDNGVVGGSPALPIKDWHRQTVVLQRLVKKQI